MIRPVLLTAIFLCNAAHAVSWSASVEQPEGLPVLSRGGAIALSSAFVFGAKNWTWAQQQARFTVLGPFAYSVAGRNQLLDFELASRVRKASERELVWEFDLNAPRTIADVSGGGIAFRFDLATVGSALGEPQLLAGNRGWAWGKAGG